MRQPLLDTLTQPPRPGPTARAAHRPRFRTPSLSTSTSTWTSCSACSPRPSSPRARLGAGYATTPDTTQRRFLETPGQITTTSDTATVRLEPRAYTPVLRKAALPDTVIPWWGGRTLRFDFT